jgi:hypothetical protein
MPRPSEDDREAIDRAFADLVAGFHLTSDRPDPLIEEEATVAELTEPSPAAESETPVPSWVDSQPLFVFIDPPAVDEAPEPEERFVPEPLMPLPRPAWPVLVAWIAMGYAVLAVLATAMGAKFPAWAGWIALVGFVGGFALLVTRLPRHRPPDAGNGAVL